jgi:hypothetical protein
MSIARILGGKGERWTKTRACRDQSPTSIAMAGDATAEAFITRQWLPDSQKLLLTVAPGEHWQAKRSSNETIRYEALVNVQHLAALGYFTVIGRIPQPLLASGRCHYLRRSLQDALLVEQDRATDFVLAAFFPVRNNLVVLS